MEVDPAVCCLHFARSGWWIWRGHWQQVRGGSHANVLVCPQKHPTASLANVWKRHRSGRPTHESMRRAKMSERYGDTHILCLSVLLVCCSDPEVTGVFV